MKGTLKLSVKNLTRQKRRNSILALAIAFGFLVVTFIDGFTSGMVENMENMITQIAGGTVLLAGYEKIPSSLPDGKAQLVNIVRDKEYVRNLVEKSNIKYKNISCYTLSGGQLIFNGKKSLTSIYGRDLNEKDFLESLQIVEGSKENFADPQALIINTKVAENLNLKIGDEVIYTTTTIYGQNTVADFKIAAITKTNSLVDTAKLFAHIETINKLVEIPEGGYSAFTIYLKNKNEQTKVANQLEAMIRADGNNVSSRLEAAKKYPANIGKGIDKQFTSKDVMWEGTKYGVETLNDEIPALKTVMSIVHTVSTVILLVILLIVMVGVSNTYRMVLYERIREIGTMRALGMEGKDTRKVFTYEAIILCVLGAAVGMLLSILIMGIVHVIPVHSEAMSMFLYKGHFTFKISFDTIILQYILLIILTTLAVRSSAKKAAKMSPAEALRTIK